MRHSNKEKVISDILDAVYVCKIESGAGPLQMTQVAARAGISTRTLNRYFPEKDTMIFEAAVRYLERQYDLIEQRYASLQLNNLCGRERLLAFMRAQIQSYRENIERAVLFVDANISCISIGITKKRRKPGFGQKMAQIVIANLELGIQDGSIAKHVDPQKMCLLISANFNGLMQRLSFLHHLSPELVKNDDFLGLFEEYVQMLEKYLTPST